MSADYGDQDCHFDGTCYRNAINAPMGVLGLLMNSLNRLRFEIRDIFVSTDPETSKTWYVALYGSTQKRPLFNEVEPQVVFFCS